MRIISTFVLVLALSCSVYAGEMPNDVTAHSSVATQIILFLSTLF